MFLTFLTTLRKVVSGESQPSDSSQESGIRLAEPLECRGVDAKLLLTSWLSPGLVDPAVGV